ncbi:MAG: glycosyl hydrolase [Planctomycetota bacterium]
MFTRPFLIFGLAICLISFVAADDTLLHLDSADEITAAGGRAQGNVTFVEGRNGKAAQFASGASIMLPFAGRFNPRQGSIDLWVRPNWRGDDAKRYALLNAQRGQTHLTIFKAEGGALLFVYRGADHAWCGVNVPVQGWKPGEWHRVTASWTPMDDETLLIMLRADDAARLGVGAVPFSDPPEVMFIGARGPNIQPAEAAIDDFLLTDRVLLKPPFALGKKEKIVAAVDASRPVGPMRRVHDFTTIWNSKDKPLPFEKGDACHNRFADANFRLARLIAFSDTWLWGTKVERGNDGKVHLDFSDFDNLVDLVRSAGAEPYIRLAYNMPQALSSIQSDDPRLRHKAAYAPPKSYDEWDALMRDIVKHCVEHKYGVRYYVTSLNEGDIPVREGKSDWQMICDLYERTVRVVREADPSAKVGGPALAADPRDAGEQFMRNFLKFCADRKLPLDFICFHGYRKGHPREYGEMVDVVRKMVGEEYPGLKPEPEYFLDEFNLWLEDKKQDNEYCAAYITAAHHFARRAGVAKICHVSFNHFLPTEVPPKDIVTHKGPFDRDGRQAARFLAGKFTAAGVEKPGILAHSPTGSNTHAFTFGGYEVPVPADGDPRLSFFTGLAIQRYPKMDGVTFRVVVICDGAETQVVDIHQREIPWQKREVSLRDFAGKTVRIEFRTSCGPPGSNTVADWGVWGEPKMVTGPTDAPTVVYDFIEKIADARTGARDPGFTFYYDDDMIRRYVGLPLLKGPVVTTPYFALKMESMLKAAELPLKMNGDGGIAPDNAAGVIASADESGIAILLWTFDLGSKEDREFEIKITGIKNAGQLALRQYLIDATHTNPYHDYVVAKKDTNGGKYNLETGTIDVVRDETIQASDEGATTLSLRLKNMAVSLVTLSKAQKE